MVALVVVAAACVVVVVVVLLLLSSASDFQIRLQLSSVLTSSAVQNPNYMRLWGAMHNVKSGRRRRKVRPLMKSILGSSRRRRRRLRVGLHLEIWDKSGEEIVR